MTLKSYTDFVIKFTLVAYNIVPALATIKEKERFQVIIEELASLIGPKNWEKLIDIFMEKVNFPKGFGKNARIPEYILWNREKFMETLSEFCEPLIGKEEPKGGQGAKIV